MVTYYKHIFLDFANEKHQRKKIIKLFGPQKFARKVSYLNILASILTVCDFLCSLKSSNYLATYLDDKLH